MWWPIRNQILVPFVVLVTLAVAASAAVAAYRAARESERQTLAQLQNVVLTLQQSSIPYTEPVLQKMHGLSGAHFLALTPDGRVVAATLETKLIADQSWEQVPVGSDLSSFAGHPTVTLGDAPYFAARLRTPGHVEVGSLIVLYPEQSWSRARRNAALPPLWIGAIAVGMAVTVSAWLAQRFSRRIALLQQQIAVIASGDFREIPLTDRRDEIHELASSVNSLSRQLRQLHQTMRQSERARLLAQLAGGLAHQLRNAVTGAKLAVQIHQKRCPLDKEDQSLPMALQQLALTEAQIKRLLSLGQSPSLPRERCNLTALVQEVLSLVQPTCQHARVDLQSQLPRSDAGSNPSPLWMQAEVEGLRAAILNLTLNAIEAAGPGGEVRVVLATVQSLAAGSADDVLLQVIDNGPGPPANVAETLFEPFVTSKPEGIGLGLALARQVALDHDGNLSWKRVDERTCFELRLPLGE